MADTPRVLLVLDTDWILRVDARGWLIITRDSMISQNRNEITAVRENKAKTAPGAPSPYPAARGNRTRDRQHLAPLAQSAVRHFGRAATSSACVTRPVFPMRAPARR